VSEATGEGAGVTQRTHETGTGDAPHPDASPVAEETAGHRAPEAAAEPGPTTHGGEPQQEGRLAAAARRHGLFALVALGAVALRVVVMLGYPPIIWFHDSYSYLESAVSHHSSAVRPGGYPFFLLLLEPLHSFVVVAAVQHLMGLATGVAIYAVLRRRGLAGWVATLAAVPVLYDAYQVQLEQMVMSDALFMVLLMLSLVVLCWNDKPGWIAAGVAGLLIGYATVVRSVGLPLIVLVAVCLLLRRVGWRPLVALVIGGVVPIGGYMIGYHAQHGAYAITQSDGIFLYGRVQAFAKCSDIKPPASLQMLCDPRPPSQRPVTTEYIWETNPLDKLAPNDGFFTPKINHEAQEFAEKAIEAQPFAYLKVVARDTMRSFFWTRTLAYDRKTDIYYLFTHHPPYIASYRPWHDLRTYQPGLGQTRAVQPFAGFLIGYQRIIYLRGLLLGLILLLGVAGVAARWRRWGGLVLLPWLTAMMLLVLPVMTSGFSYRYELAVVPFACLAGGLALAGVTRRKPDRTGEPSSPQVQGTSPEAA
jgi:hypothetical protein